MNELHGRINITIMQLFPFFCNFRDAREKVLTIAWSELYER